MKLNKLIYGVLTIFAFSSCADQMEYSEYNPYDAGYVKRTFYEDWYLTFTSRSTLISEIIVVLFLVLLRMNHNIPIQVMLLRLFTMGHGVR